MLASPLLVCCYKNQQIAQYKVIQNQEFDRQNYMYEVTIVDSLFCAFWTKKEQKRCCNFFKNNWRSGRWRVELFN